MTESQTYLRQAEAIATALEQQRRIADQLARTIQDMEHEEAQLRGCYYTAHRRELLARRTYMPEKPYVPMHPNPVPYAQNLIWAEYQRKVTSHRDYSSQPMSWNNQHLLSSLAHFNQAMLAITDTQAWNARNPNPHLP